MKLATVALTSLFVLAGVGLCFGDVLEDQVDIGDLSSEATHELLCWGDIQYGDLHEPPGPYGDVDHCRGIDCPESMGDGDCIAEVTMDFGAGYPTTPRRIRLRHLEGQAVDAFNLYIYEPGDSPPGMLLHSYPGDPQNTTMIWNICEVDVVASGLNVLHLECTSEHWSGWETYGQMYFDWIEVVRIEASCVEEATWSGIKALYK